MLFTFVSNSLSYIPILRKKIQTKDKIEPQHIHRQITDNNVFFGFLNYFGLYGKEEGLKILETNLTRVEQIKEFSRSFPRQEVNDPFS